MPLTYDFDIQSVMPEDRFSDPKAARIMALSGITFDGLTNKMPLFRDPATAAALRAAPDHIRQPFLDAGFGFGTYASGAPAGCYPARDTEARRQFLTKLGQTLKRETVSTGDIGGFNVAAFLAAQSDAQPLSAGQFQPKPEPLSDDLPSSDTITHPSNSIVGAVMSASFGLLGGLALIAYTAMELLK